MAEDTAKIKIVGSRRARERFDDHEDAPEPREAEQSGQIFVDAIRTTTPGSPAERALILAHNLFLETRKAAPPPGSGITAAIIYKLVVLVIVALPAVYQGFGMLAELVGPRSTVEAKLDLLLEHDKEVDAALLALVRWSIDCERAERAGQPMPQVPPVLTLIVARDDAAKE